jgi:hypothetical protein
MRAAASNEMRPAAQAAATAGSGRRARDRRARFAGAAARHAEPLLGVVARAGELQSPPVVPLGHGSEDVAEPCLQLVLDVDERTDAPVERASIARGGIARAGFHLERAEACQAGRHAGESAIGEWRGECGPCVGRAAESGFDLRLGRAVGEPGHVFRNSRRVAGLRFAHERLDELRDGGRVPLDAAEEVERLVECGEGRTRHGKPQQDAVGIGVGIGVGTGVGVGAGISIGPSAGHGAGGVRGSARLADRRAQLAHAENAGGRDPLLQGATGGALAGGCLGVSGARGVGTRCAVASRARDEDGGDAAERAAAVRSGQRGGERRCCGEGLAEGGEVAQPAARAPRTARARGRRGARSRKNSRRAARRRWTPRVPARPRPSAARMARAARSAAAAAPSARSERRCAAGRAAGGSGLAGRSGVAGESARAGGTGDAVLPIITPSLGGGLV